MKKLFTFLFFSICLIQRIDAQKDYKDLLSLYVDEKYEKVLYKAENYTLADATKKDPMPYLFMSMTYFQMSKKDEFKEKYPDAFKNSLKYMAKYASKDKERVCAAEYEDFFNDLRIATISEGEIMFDQQKYTKAKSMYDYLTDIDPNDAGAYIMLGMTFEAMKSKKEAGESIAKAKSLLSEKKAGHGTKEQNTFLKHSLIHYASKLSDSGDKAGAKEWMDYGLEYFKDDKEFMVNYETIVG